ncbi:MAG: NAD(+)/NADH kinase [bacterium]
MIELKSVGILLRDPDQNNPLDYLKSVFEKVGSTLHILNRVLPREKLDLIIALGGDGTVLKALDLNPDCPVLAVNFGTVGFLTAGDGSELESMVSRLLEGKFQISERIQLYCEYPGGSANVVNEVALRTSWRMINVDVWVDNAKIRTIRGDGVIVGTPTGSTGYLLSTGGPIVMPGAQCFVLDGINEYNFTSRALILPDTARIHLRVGELLPDQEAFLYVDGMQIARLESGAELDLSRSNRVVRLIFFDEDYFFRNLSSRLDWN